MLLYLLSRVGLIIARNRVVRDIRRWFVSDGASRINDDVQPLFFQKLLDHLGHPASNVLDHFVAIFLALVLQVLRETLYFTLFALALGIQIRLTHCAQFALTALQLSLNI